MSHGTKVADVSHWLQEFAPLTLAEKWDNVGLLVGEEQAAVKRVLTCLTLTTDVAREAIDWGAQLIVTHHPVLFSPVQRITSATTEGSMLLQLIRAGISVYSPHTAFDSAAEGINADLARRFGLQDVQPIRPTETDPTLGGGRWGRLAEPVTFDQFQHVVMQALDVAALHFVGNRKQTVSRVAVACGAAGEFLSAAARLGCDLFVTGETRYHTCLEARSLGIALILAGHHATERPAVEWLADRLGKQFPTLEVRASAVETDPVQWV